MDCTKYLTACAGCTKKHAKCTWNDISEEEVVYILGGAEGCQGGGSGSGSAGGDNINTAGNGVSDMNANLDPGLRGADGGAGAGAGMGGTGSGGGGMSMQGNGEVFDDLMHGQQHQQQQREGIDDQQHIILSRMASSATAAATAGRTT